jgi:hypothetical protein
MAEPAPQLVVLKDLESLARDFICSRPFRFSLREFQGKEYEIQIRPLTQAQLAESRQFSQIAPPKVKKPKEEGSAEMVVTDEDDWLDKDFQKELAEKSSLRRAYVFLRALPEIKFGSEKIEAVAKEIEEKFPEPYSVAIEKEIFRQSTNELAIINLANFSASDGSAQS